MIAAGVATIIQSLNRGPLGSGYLCAQGNDPTIIAFSILAGKAGGLPLILGMTALSGLTECFLSRFLHRLRTIFPAEVTGVILTMVGLTLLPYTIADFFGVKGNNGVIHGATTAVGVITLAICAGSMSGARASSGSIRSSAAQGPVLSPPDSSTYSPTRISSVWRRRRSWPFPISPLSPGPSARPSLYR
jgi:NCS2 family nucleobase:cation symporter-2